MTAEQGERFSCPPDHAHGGTTTCYTMHKCRCARCVERRRVDAREIEARRRRGELQEYVPASDVVPRLIELMSHGWEYADISMVSGVSVPTISRIMRGVTKRVQVETSDAILGTHLNMRHRARTPRLVDATGTARRLQALSAMGWPWRELSRRLGRTKHYVYNIIGQETVTPETREAVVKLYDDMWDKQPPADTPAQRAVIRKLQRRAAGEGWAPPLAWDDDTIDDPTATPVILKRVHVDPDRLEPEVIEAALHGDQPELSRAERQAVVTRLVEWRWSTRRIAEYIDCNVKTIERDRSQLKLPAYLANGTHHTDGTLAA